MFTATQEKTFIIVIFAKNKQKTLHSEVTVHLLTSFVRISAIYICIDTYITGANGHELSGRVRAHAMPGLNARGWQSKLLITPLSE